MPDPLTDELHEFHRFLGNKLGGGETEISPEEALDEWRRSHPEPESFLDDVSAIQQAIDDMANGDQGTPFDDFDREFRKRHNLPAEP